MAGMCHDDQTICTESSTAAATVAVRGGGSVERETRTTPLQQHAARASVFVTSLPRD